MEGPSVDSLNFRHEFTVNDDLQGFAHDSTDLHISDMNQFSTGLVDPTRLDSCNPWDWNTWGGCANNLVQTANTVIVQPTANFVNNNIVQPVVNNIVKPIVNKVVVPLVNNVVIPYIKASYNALVQSYSYISSAGNQAWNGYQGAIGFAARLSGSTASMGDVTGQPSSLGAGGDSSSHDQCIGQVTQFELAAGATLALAGAIELILIASDAEEVFPPVAHIPVAIVAVAGALALIGAGIAFTCGSG